MSLRVYLERASSDWNSYYVCEKSDGFRYLMYLTDDTDHTGEHVEVVYLIDRRNDFWFIPKGGLHFPTIVNEGAFHTNTLIDGELVMDKKRPGDPGQPNFLVFDCLVLDGMPLINRTLDKRLAYFKQEIYSPYVGLLKKYPEEVQYQHFLVEMKSMQFSYGIEMMFRDILPRLPHGNDGLIFTCRNTEYKSGTDPHILKWKPENENSIDFRLSLDIPIAIPDEIDIAEGITEPYKDYNSTPVFNLYPYAGDNKEDPWFASMHVEPDEWEALKALQEPLDDRIVECFMDAQKRWRYMKFRDDKQHANHTSTVESVIESIRDRVTKDDLAAAAKRIRDEWKRREQEEKMRSGAAINGVKRKAEDGQGGGRPSPAPPGAK